MTPEERVTYIKHRLERAKETLLTRILVNRKELTLTRMKRPSILKKHNIEYDERYVWG